MLDLAKVLKKILLDSLKNAKGPLIASSVTTTLNVLAEVSWPYLLAQAIKGCDKQWNEKVL